VRALALGLLASLSWGFADFIGGFEARRLPVLTVLLLSQPRGSGRGRDVSAECGRAPTAADRCGSGRGACGVIMAGALTVRRPLPARQLDLPWLVAIGVLEFLGASLYAIVTTVGQVSLVAVAASLYPAITMVLAARVVHERLGRGQRIGVVLTLLGIAAIAMGG
jgi:EamA-like transporter family